MSQAHYDVFREQLAIKYPAFGHAMWEPNPRNPDRPVQVGDVGFIRRGKFHRLFNALLPADDPTQELGVPEYHEPLVPSVLDHIDKGSLDSNNYCSAGVKVEADQGYQSFGPDDFRHVSFQYERTRGAAVLSLPVAARSENTLAQGDFGRWIVKHISTWFAFARKLGLGIEQMEEVILVTGCDRSKSWTNVAFLGGQADAQVTFGVKVEGTNPSINFQFSPENARGGLLRHGPEGTNLPENQCVFLRGFRVARSFWILPKHLKAAAGPSRDPGGYDCDPGTELISIPAAKQYRDPLHLLLDYIAEQVSDCDMVIAHDGDLVAVDGLGHDTSLKTLKPDVMMDLLRRSNIEIHKIWCDSSPNGSPSSPSTDMAIVKVAMLSITFQNWNTVSLFQRPPPTARNIDLDPTNECHGRPTPTLPSTLPAPTIRGETNSHDISLLAEHGDSLSTTLQDSGDSAPLDGGHDADRDTLTPDKTRNTLSSVWSSLHEFVQVERHRLVPAIAVTFCFVLLFGWTFSFNLDAIFKVFLALLASVPLSVLFERKSTNRRLDDIYERIDALQYHVMSLQTNLAVPAVQGVRYSVPIMPRAAPEIPIMFGQSHGPGMVPSVPVAYYHRGTPTPSVSPVIPSPPSRWGEMPYIPPDLGPPRAPRLYQPYLPPAPSPPANARRKPRSSKFFDRIKFPPFRTTRPVPPSPATDGSVPHSRFSPTIVQTLPAAIVQTLPPTIVQSSSPINIQRKPRSSKIFNRIRYAFTTRPPPPVSSRHHSARVPTLSRTPSPPYPARPGIINVPSHPGPMIAPTMTPMSSMHRYYGTRTPSSRSPSPPYHFTRPSIINVPSQPGVEVQHRSSSPTSFMHRRYRSRAPALSRTPSPPYPIPHPTIFPQPVPVTKSLHSPSPRYSLPTSPFIRPAASPHPLSEPVRLSDGRTASISSLRTHRSPEEATPLESL